MSKRLGWRLRERFSRRREKRNKPTATTMRTDNSTVGIEETAELTTFLATVSKFIADKAKGGFKKHEIFAALPLIDDAMGAFGGIEKIPAELADLQPSEVEEIRVDVHEALEAAFPDDVQNFDRYITLALELVTPIVKFFQSISDEAEAPTLAD